MKSNKKIFNLNQYIEAVKHTKMIGIICTVIILLISIFIPVNSRINIQKSIDAGYSTAVPSIVSIYSNDVFLIATFVIITPLLTLFMWNYLTKRSSSDFNHSLPYTRQCAFFGNVLAIVTWQVIMLLSSALVTAASYAVMNDYFIIDYSEIVHMYLAIFSANLLCMAAISVACIITGNVFSNICVSGLILFFPQFLIYSCAEIVEGNVPIIMKEHIVPIFSYVNNIVVGTVLAVFGSTNPMTILSRNEGVIYTFILALIYICIAAVLYKVRKSETAGQSASGKRLQSVIRIVIGFSVIWLFGIITSVGEFIDNNLSWDSALYRIVLVFIVAAIAMLIYEAISTKKLSRLQRIIPSVIITYVISAAAFFGLYGIIMASMNYSPSSDQVTSISFTYSDNDSYYTEAKNYFASCTGTVKIDSQEIKEIFTKALSDNNNIIKNGGSFHEYIYRNKLSEYKVQFREGGSTKYRLVYLTQEQVNKFTDALNSYSNTSAGSEFAKAYRDLPAADECSVEMTGSSYELESQSDIDKIYQQILDEAATVSFADWYMNVNDIYNVSNVSLSVSFLRNGQKYEMLIPITDKLPKTLSMCNELVNSENARYADDMKKQIVNVLDNHLYGGSSTSQYEDESSNVRMIFCKAGETRSYLRLNQYIIANENERTDIVRKMADGIGSDKPIDEGRAYVIIDCYQEDSQASDVDIYGAYYKNMYYVVQLEGYDEISDYMK